MNTADLNKRITIEAPMRATDSQLGETVTWATIASAVPAAIWPVSASEQVRAGQAAMTITHRIRIRYRRVMKPDWRISWAGRYFNIVSITDPNEAHKWLDLLCKEVVL